LPDIRVQDSPLVAGRKQDIASWKEADISKLGGKAKRRFQKRKAALEAYFTTGASLEEIALRYHISEKTLTNLAEKCLVQHEDGSPWGFRALLPGKLVVDHVSCQEDEATGGANEETGKRPAVRLDTPPSIAAIVVPETPDVVGEEESEEDISPDNFVKDAVEENMPSELVDVLVASEEEVEETVAFVAEKAGGDQDEELGPIPAMEDTEVPATEGTPEAAIEAVPALVAEEIAKPSTREVEAGSAEEVKSETSTGGEAGAFIVGGAGEEGAVVPASVNVGMVRKATQSRRASELSHHMVYRHRQREAKQQKRRRLRTILATSMIVALLVVVALPAALGLAAYSAYTNVRGVAMDGVDRLLKVKTILAVSKSDPLAALNVAKLQQAQVEFKGAESDFLQLQQLLSRPGIQSTVNQFSPQYGSELEMGERLVRVGLDVSRMGNEVSGVALMGANLLHSSPLSSGSTKPLITVSDIASIEGALEHALYYIDDIQTQMSQVSLQELPISASQKAELAAVMPLLPRARDYIVQVQGMVGLVAWLLGVGQPRRFLVQTLDSAELRPSGGFAGQYGILQIQDGRIAPFTLRDVALLDYAGNGSELVQNGSGPGRSAPPQYSSWMNFGYFGLRDSNLSADYPTTAKLNMQIFQDEGGGPVDGDIELTPAVISHVLEVTGPIKVAEYNDIVTAQNLEDKLHYYQQNYSAIALEKQKTNSTSNEARKAFTSLVGQLLMSKVRHLPVSKLIEIGKLALQDIKSRDLQIYFTNPAAEAWLVAHGYSGSMSTFSKTDGFMVVQANISISKASQYVHTTEQDAITLDAQGGATHVLTITLDYQQTGPVYGYDTYADYVRIYAPANAQFLWGDGFDSGKPLCTPTTPGSKGSGGKGSGTGTDTGTGTGTGTGTTSGCAQYNTSFPDSARYCPNGDYQLGDRYTNVAWPIDSLGPPTEMTSDLPGRAMWGGLTETPKNCITTITVSYYVPHAVTHDAAGQPVYSLLVQKQGGLIPTVDISVDPSAIKGLKAYNYSGNLTADKLITLSMPAKK